MPNKTLRLNIIDQEGNHLPSAIIKIKSINSSIFSDADVTYNTQLKTYFINVAPGSYVIKAEFGQLRSFDLTIEITNNGLSETLILGAENSSYYYSGIDKRKIPYERNENLIGIWLSATMIEIKKAI
jgi:hypothetical protein